MLRTTFDSSGATMSGANKSAMQRYLIISGHDFRTPRWANMHFIARELARRGTTRFFSLACSPLSYLIGDPRLPILARANRIEEFRGVQCYLWKSAWHPVNLDFSVLAGLSRLLFIAYRRDVPGRFPALGREQRRHHPGIRHAADFLGADPTASTRKPARSTSPPICSIPSASIRSFPRSSRPISICSTPSSCHRG